MKTTFESSWSVYCRISVVLTDGESSAQVSQKDKEQLELSNAHLST